VCKIQGGLGLGAVEKVKKKFKSPKRKSKKEFKILIHLKE
jgi:hypothetical protein